MTTLSTAQIEFARNFLLAVDPLGVYHVDNENEDEYDAYIEYTAKCLRSGCAPYTWASNLINLMTSYENGGRYKGADHRIPAMVVSFDNARREYKKVV